MFTFETVSAAMLAPAAPALGLAPEGTLSFAPWSTTLAWGLGGLLTACVAGLATQVEAIRIHYTRRVHAMRAAAWRLAPWRRSRAGASSGRVTPRSAAGSPPL